MNIRNLDLLKQMANKFPGQGKMMDIYASHKHSVGTKFDKHWTDTLGHNQYTNYWPVYFTTGNPETDYWNVKATYIDPSGSKRVYTNFKTDKACMVKSWIGAKRLTLLFATRTRIRKSSLAFSVEVARIIWSKRARWQTSASMNPRS